MDLGDIRARGLRRRVGNAQPREVDAVVDDIGAIEQRARHLGISHCRTRVGDKQEGLAQLQRELGMAREATAFLGDDLNDLAARPVCGLLVAPADAAEGLRQQADWLLRHRGGAGALREFTEALLASQGHLAALHRHGWREGNH